MSEHQRFDPRRRRVLGATAAATVAIPLSVFLGRSAQAGDLPKLSEDDPAAQGLNYVADASKSKNPSHTAGAHCGNCNLYQGGDAPYGACSVFPGKAVANAGWCVAWVARPG